MTTDLVTTNLALVTWTVRRYFARLPRWYCGSHEDLHQAGVMGLMRAAQAFDPSKGYAFSTFATKCIFNAVRHEVRKGALVHVPQCRPKSLALRRLKARANRTTRLEALKRDARDRELPIADHRQTLAEEREILDQQRQTRRKARRLLQRLTPREREAIVLTFLDGNTFRKAGEVMGVTYQRVRQLREAGLKRLREGVGA